MLQGAHSCQACDGTQFGALLRDVDVGMSTNRPARWRWRSYR